MKSIFALIGGLLILFAATQATAAAQIIELTQVPCQILEAEAGVNHGYRSKHISDCEAINAKSAKARAAANKALELKPGEYVFRVANRDVPYELGFWLRGDGAITRTILPSVSGGGLSTGKTRDYKITLKPGEYVYSCPLNTTPDYRLIVR